MSLLWAPWRVKYVTGKKKKKCVFCEAAKSPKSQHVIFKTKYSLVVLNIYPYNNGHVMVAPLRHIGDVSSLTEQEAMDMFRAVKKIKKILDKVMKAHGYNIGMNQGGVSGAGIPGHLHLHIVPRWLGDTNFMPTIFSTRVISQSLKELQKKLIDAYAKTN